MFWAAFTGAASHWRRHPGQFAALLLGLALATALWSGVQAINAEARASYALASNTLGQSGLQRLVPTSGDIRQDTYIALRRGGWSVSPVIDGQLTRDSGLIQVLGMEPVTAPTMSQMVDLSDPEDLAAFLKGRIYASPDLGAEFGGTFEGRELRVSAALPPRTLLADIGTAQRMLDMADRFSYLTLSNEQLPGRESLKGLAPGLNLQEPEETGDIARLTRSFHLNLTAFGFLSFAVGLFIVHAAIGLAFEQRRPTFRTLRALGVSARMLVAVLATEILCLAIIAGLAGVGLGYIVAAALLPDVAATLRGLYGASVSGSLTLDPSWWAFGVLIAIAGAGVASAQALWRVWSLPVLAPAQPRAWARVTENSLRLQAVASVLLFAIGGVLAVVGGGLQAGFAMLGAILLGAALLLPVLLSWILKLGQSLAKGPVSGWFWADTRQQLPGLSLALMALLLALSANIGVSTMVASFRLTFTGWLDQRLASELYVTARSDVEAERLRAFLAPRSDAVLPIWNTEGRVLGAPAEIYGVADHATYRDHWPLLSGLPDAWDRVAAGDGVLVNEQLARRERLELGQLVDLPGDWGAEVVGVYSDYGNPKGQVLIGLGSFAERYPDAPKLRYAVRVPKADVESLMQALEDDFGLPASTMIDQESIKRVSLEIFERTFTVTAALNVLTLSVAALAMLTSLLTLSTMRLPQVGPVWAMGLTRRQIGWLELVRAGLLGALTAILAIPVGLVLAWSLLTVVNVEAFGWRLPMFLFPGDWAVLFCAAVATALLAAAWPMRRLSHIAPSELVKVFVNER